jgi:integrase
LEDAFNDGLVDANEAARVKKLDERGKGDQQRRAFTVAELSKILDAADPEWKGMVLTSLYAGGMRLGDVADLKWEYIDLGNREIRFKTEKTGRQTLDAGSVLSTDEVDGLHLTAESHKKLGAAAAAKVKEILK